MTIEFKQGPYRCEILDQGLSESKNKNPQIWLKIRPIESLSVEDEGIELPTADRMVYWTITEKTIDFITDKLATLGFTGESFGQLDRNHANPELFIGQTEDFYCKHETYEGNEREKWDLSRSDFEAKPLEASETRKLDAMFGRKLKDRVKGVSSVAKPAKKPVDEFNQELAEVASDDDIAF